MKLAEKMINPIRNQKGIALVVTLMMLVLGFAVVAILFRLSTQETKLARLEQGYTTALDAAKAGTDLFIEMVESSQGGATPVGNPPGTPPLGTNFLAGACLTFKMSNPTAGWTAQPAGCPTQDQATSPFPDDPTDTAHYYNDTTIPLANNYTVYVKVIDNFQTSPMTHAQIIAANCSAATCPCETGCDYYTVLARAQAQGSNEHADVQFVYRFALP